MDSFNVIYKGYIRPHLEFCIQAKVSAILAKDKLVLENVQRRATCVDGRTKVTKKD